MLDIKTLNISLDAETITRLKAGLRELFYGTPLWLRRILVLSLVIGLGYFVYSRVKMSYDVEEVAVEIETLKEKFSQTIYSEQYVYDISNVIITIRTLQEINDDQERCVMQFLEILEECVKLHDSNSPTLRKISTLKTHITLMNDSHRNIIKHQIKVYDEWLDKQGVKTNFNTRFDYEKEDSINRFSLESLHK